MSVSRNTVNTIKGGIIGIALGGVSLLAVTKSHAIDDYSNAQASGVVIGLMFGALTAGSAIGYTVSRFFQPRPAGALDEFLLPENISDSSINLTNDAPAPHIRNNQL